MMHIPASASAASLSGGGRDRVFAVDAADGEARWFLSEEVFRSLAQILAAIDACLESLPAPARPDAPCCVQERFVMQQASQGGADTAKCVLVMEGAAIVQAELQVKIHKHPNTIHKTSIQPEAPWALSQLQDAANMLAEARACAERAAALRDALSAGGEPLDAAALRRLAHRLESAAEELMLRLRRGRDALLNPRKKTILDHLNSENMRALRPPLPGDIAVSFYVQGARLVLAVYHLRPSHGSLHFESFLAEASLARLENVLDGFSHTFQLCQEVRSKLYWATRCPERPRRRPPATVLNGL